MAGKKWKPPVLKESINAIGSIAQGKNHNTEKALFESQEFISQYFKTKSPPSLDDWLADPSHRRGQSYEQFSQFRPRYCSCKIYYLIFVMIVIMIAIMIYSPPSKKKKTIYLAPLCDFEGVVKVETLVCSVSNSMICMHDIYEMYI